MSRIASRLHHEHPHALSKGAPLGLFNEPPANAAPLPFWVYSHDVHLAHTVFGVYARAHPAHRLSVLLEGDVDVAGLAVEHRGQVVSLALLPPLGVEAFVNECGDGSAHQRKNCIPGSERETQQSLAVF